MTGSSLLAVVFLVFEARGRRGVVTGTFLLAVFLLVLGDGARRGVVVGTFHLVVLLLQLLAVSVGLQFHPGFGLRARNPRLGSVLAFLGPGFLRCVDAGAFLRVMYFLELVAVFLLPSPPNEEVWAHSSGEVDDCCLGPSFRGSCHRSWILLRRFPSWSLPRRLPRWRR